MLHLQGTGLENEGDTQRLLIEACSDLPDKKSKEVLQMHEAMCFCKTLDLTDFSRVERQLRAFFSLQKWC